MNNWLKMGLNVMQAVSFKNPIAMLIITAIKAIVEKRNDGISDKSVIDVVQEMAKSKYNNLDTDKVLRIIDIINEKDQIAEDIQAIAENHEVNTLDEIFQSEKTMSVDTFMKAKEVLK